MRIGAPFVNKKTDPGHFRLQKPVEWSNDCICSVLNFTVTRVFFVNLIPTRGKITSKKMSTTGSSFPLTNVPRPAAK